MICVFVVYEIIILAWLQVTYFNSQQRNCMNSAPDLYFWAMGQILVIYMGLAVVVCHFFRKFCQDPPVEGEEENDIEMKGAEKEEPKKD